MASFDVSRVVGGLGDILDGLRLVREEAEATEQTVERTRAAAAAAGEENRGRFQEVVAQTEVIQSGFTAISNGFESATSLAGEAVVRMGARVEEVEERVQRTREVVSRESQAAEEDAGRVRQALEQAGRAAEAVGATAKETLTGLLGDIEITGQRTSDLLRQFDLIQEQVPPQLRNYIALSEGWFGILQDARSELNVLRDQVQSGALDVSEIIGRLGELQTIYANRILQALARLKDGGEAALRELRQLLSEAQRIPDSATGLLAGALANALRDGHL